MWKIPVACTNEIERIGAFALLFYSIMFDIGDVVSVRTIPVDGFPHGRNAIGGLFPVNRDYYEIITDIGNGIYVIGVGNFAIAAVCAGELRLESASMNWPEIIVGTHVKIKNGARNWMGYPLPSYVYNQDFVIDSVLFDRVLLRNDALSLAVKAEDLL